MFDEIKSHAADTATIEDVEVLVGEAIVDDRDATVAARVGGDAIKHRGIVGAMATRLHNHRAIYSEMRVQRRQHLLRGIRRRITAVRRIGKFRRRSEYMAMRVTAAGRQPEAGFAAVGEKVRLDVHGVALAKRQTSYNPSKRWQVAQLPSLHDVFAEGGKSASDNCGANPGHEGLVIGEIDRGQQHRAKNLVGLDQVM